jgi:hypothetical protein
LKDRNGKQNVYSNPRLLQIPNVNGGYNSYINEPIEEITITENGVFNVKDKARAVVAVETGAIECDGCVVEVDTLPTENIEENALYKIGNVYNKYEEIFEDMIVVFDGEKNSLNDIFGAYYIYVKKRPVENISISSDEQFFLYYIENEKDIFVYGDFEKNGNNRWVTLAELSIWNGFKCGGAIEDINDANEEETYYAVVRKGWRSYIEPIGYLKITENGVHNIAEKEHVYVSVPTMSIVQAYADLPTDVSAGSWAIVLGG